MFEVPLEYLLNDFKCIVSICFYLHTLFVSSHSLFNYVSPISFMTMKITNKTYILYMNLTI